MRIADGFADLASSTPDKRVDGARGNAGDDHHRYTPLQQHEHLGSAGREPMNLRLHL